MLPHERELYRQFAEAILIQPKADPHNPWPPGCDWHDKHNEIWRRDRARRSLIDQTGGEGGI